MSAPAPLPAGTVLRRRFELTAVIGQGATGTVYRGIDHRWRRAGAGQAEVAVKVARDRAWAGPRIRYEGHVLRRLHHPHIVRLRGTGRAGGLVFLALDLLSGETLAQRLAKRSGHGLDEEMALRVVAGLGAALGSLHGLGLIHGDLKPGNIMVGPDGHAVLIDLATSRAFRPSVPGVGSGGRPPFAGDDVTPAYASPARLAGLPPDPRDDVFALAVVAATMLAGRHPFAGRTVTEAPAPERPPGLDGVRWAVLRRALAPEARARPRDPAAFAAQLRHPGLADRLWGWGAALAIPHPRTAPILLRTQSA